MGVVYRTSLPLLYGLDRKIEQGRLFIEFHQYHSRYSQIAQMDHCDSKQREIQDAMCLLGLGIPFGLIPS